MKLTTLLFLSSFAVLFFGGCKKSSTFPECLQAKIDAFKNSSCPQGASVKEYKFQDKLVYVFGMGNCGADFGAAVLDSQCNPIGSLGGFIGNTDIGGVSFSTAVYKRTIWSR